MSFVIAFFRHSSTADVVPASAVNGEVRRGVTTKVRWGGRAYIAKILYVGPRELCESKVGLVTADGELTDEPFDIVPFEDSVTNEHTAVRPETPTAAERESVLQLRTIQENLATAVELLNKSLKNDKKEELRAERIEKMLAEVLNRLPAPSQGCNILIISSRKNVSRPDRLRFASAGTVANLRKANEKSMKFVRLLDDKVFRDRKHEQQLKVDERSVDRVNFIKECLFKFYDVPVVHREDLWKRAKSTLNEKARRLRKTLRDGFSREGDGMRDRLLSDDEFDFVE
ncbi:hypothetical protein Q1695_001437 [Nippostrongylus brasiliensis]|nr:hypothetical protein Q1695_001437 [Nippostrongylus brasiliensis]